MNILKEFSSFDESGWDGFNAEPVSSKTAMLAVEIVASLPGSWRDYDAAPGADGSVCFEWVRGQKIIALDVNANGHVVASRWNKDGHGFINFRTIRKPDEIIAATDIAARFFELVKFSIKE